MARGRKPPRKAEHGVGLGLRPLRCRENGTLRCPAGASLWLSEVRQETPFTQRAVYLAYQDMPDFGEQQPITYQARTITPLRVRETVVVIAALKARIPRLLTRFHAAEEGFEGAVYPQYHILQDLGMDSGAIVSAVAYLRQLGFLLVVTNRYLPHLPGIAPFLERRIVQFAAHTQNRLQLFCLSRRWRELVLERLACGYV